MILNSNDFFPTIETGILSGAIKTFPTKLAALNAGEKFGWRKALKVARRFEAVWIVGAVDFQDSYEANVAIQYLRLPLLKYEKGVQPILILRKPVK